MRKVLLAQIVQTDYGQFDLVWGPSGGFDGDLQRFFAGQTNGLVGAADPSGVYVNLARRAGGSALQIVLLDAPPDRLGDYEDVVEVSTTIPPSTQVRWQSWAAESSGVLSDVDSGTYRLRVSARGRDAGRTADTSDGIVDAYLLEFWPAPLAHDQVVRVGSRDAMYWHSQRQPPADEA